MPQDASTAGPTLTRNRATVRPTRRPARRAHRLPHRLAPHGSPTQPRRTRSGRPGLDPTQRRPLSPTRTTELQDAPHGGVGTDSKSCHGQSHATTGSTGPPASQLGRPHGGPTSPRRTRSGRSGARPPPSGDRSVKAHAPTTSRNLKPLWYPIHSTASEGSPPDQPRLGFRHSWRTVRNLPVQAGPRQISRRQPGDPTSAYTHLTVWAGRRDSESEFPPTSAP
jgi:hypothetical protein